MIKYLVLILAYLIGSIPFGYIAGKINGINVLEKGSKSMGTTNVIRLIGTKWGILVLLLDIFKGFLAPFITFIATNSFTMSAISGIMVMLGHSKSIFIKFRGGKSAATGIGVILMMNWQIFLITAILVFAIRQISGYQSIASLFGSFSVPILMYLFKAPVAFLIFSATGAAFVWLKHIPNIKRLLNGEESKITKKGKQ